MANCTICGKILSFLDKNKACPECAEAHKSMMTLENEDMVLTIAEKFQAQIPAMQDQQMKEFLQGELDKVYEKFKPENPLMHTSTDGFEGYDIVDYKDIVIIKEVYETGKAQTLDRLKAARPSFSKLDRQAKKLGANAIIGIKVEYSIVVSDQSGMWSKVMETTTGTAVVVEKSTHRIGGCDFD